MVTIGPEGRSNNTFKEKLEEVFQLIKNVWDVDLKTTKIFLDNNYFFTKELKPKILSSEESEERLRGIVIDTNDSDVKDAWNWFQLVFKKIEELTWEELNMSYYDSEGQFIELSSGRRGLENLEGSRKALEDKVFYPAITIRKDKTILVLEVTDDGRREGVYEINGEWYENREHPISGPSYISAGEAKQTLEKFRTRIEEGVKYNKGENEKRHKTRLDKYAQSKDTDNSMRNENLA